MATEIAHRASEVMAPNSSAENAPSPIPIEILSSPVMEGKKRKVEEVRAGKENGKSEKKAKVESEFVHLDERLG